MSIRAKSWNLVVTAVDTANQHTGKLFLLGLGAVLWHNWRQWQRDRARLASLPPTAPAPDWRSWPEQPRVSILVAAWNEAGAIRDHIESVQRLTYPNKELILCAGGEDDTYQISLACADEQVIVLPQKAGEGKQAALRKSLPHATGEILFLTDADCLLDEAAFLSSLAPLVLEGEQVTTGSSRPLSRQRSHPFVLHQWAADAYVDARRPESAAGLFGRNCAVRRTALEEAGAFDADVRTGTDYYLAERLKAAGYRLRFIPESLIETRYAETFHSYARRQSRWIRNLLIHGPAFGATDLVGQALRTALLGWIMILMPLSALVVGPVALVLWGLLFAQSFLARIRYLGFLRARHGIHLNSEQVVRTPAHLLADFCTWSRSLFDLLLRRDRW
jgi:glycosyltransferase involved in cell wall biosynthesis